MDVRFTVSVVEIFHQGKRVASHARLWTPKGSAYTPGPTLQPGVWFEYEIVVLGDDYKVFLTNLQSGQRTQTCHFLNTDTARGRAPGCIGIQAYPGSAVAWRHIRIRP